LKVRKLKSSKGHIIIYEYEYDGKKLIEKPYARLRGYQYEAILEPPREVPLKCPNCGGELEVLDRPLAVYVRCIKCGFTDLLGYKVD